MEPVYPLGVIDARRFARHRSDWSRATIGCLERRSTTVLRAATKPEHVPVLRELGVFDQLVHENHAFDNTLDAFAHARLHQARIQQ
ncbi:hypothetical protein [Corynebacterium imitans]|uniref:hypothetical protein n=1 Tax=Corynebacterium imitans TaxID=156978 RepID=UPI001EF16586|nr:hypothetical protein [Corynebacterium imitans]